MSSAFRTFRIAPDFIRGHRSAKFFQALFALVVVRAVGVAVKLLGMQGVGFRERGFAVVASPLGYQASCLGGGGRQCSVEPSVRLFVCEVCFVSQNDISRGCVRIASVGLFPNAVKKPEGRRVLLKNLMSRKAAGIAALICQAGSALLGPMKQALYRILVLNALQWSCHVLK